MLGNGGGCRVCLRHPVAFAALRGRNSGLFREQEWCFPRLCSHVWMLSNAQQCSAMPSRWYAMSPKIFLETWNWATFKLATFRILVRWRLFLVTFMSVRHGHWDTEAKPSRSIQELQSLRRIWAPFWRWGLDPWTLPKWAPAWAPSRICSSHFEWYLASDPRCPMTVDADGREVTDLINLYATMQSLDLLVANGMTRWLVQGLEHCRISE